MCHAVRCEVCGLLMDYYEYYTHVKTCKPETEKVEASARVEVRRKRQV